MLHYIKTWGGAPHRRYWIASLAIVVLLALVVACGQNDPQAGAAEAQAAAAEAKAAAAEAQAAKAQAAAAEARAEAA